HSTSRHCKPQGSGVDANQRTTPKIPVIARSVATKQSTLGGATGTQQYAGTKPSGLPPALRALTMTDKAGACLCFPLGLRSAFVFFTRATLGKKSARPDNATRAEQKIMPSPLLGGEGDFPRDANRCRTKRKAMDCFQQRR
ncbi:MAG: hypothetical protein LBP52_02150, partial [Burkholderiaceae bacterium]|nr:hypothetical protein [Burkholderiaceae bacterium]